MSEAVTLLGHRCHAPYAPLVGCMHGADLYRCSFGGFVLPNLQRFAETRVWLCLSRGTRKFQSSTDESDCRDGEPIDEPIEVVLLKRICMHLILQEEKCYVHWLFIVVHVRDTLREWDIANTPVYLKILSSG